MDILINKTVSNAYKMEWGLNILQTYRKKKNLNQNNPTVPKINPTSDYGSDHTWSHKKTELAALLFWAHPTNVQWCISCSTCTSLSETSGWHHSISSTLNGFFHISTSNSYSSSSTSAQYRTVSLSIILERKIQFVSK